MAKWSEEDKLRALAIAEASSTLEAEIETGIPAATIRSWRKRMNLNQKPVVTKSTTRNATLKKIATERATATQHGVTSKKVQKLTEEAIEQAKEEVKEFIVDEIKDWAMQIKSMSLAAVMKAKEAVEQGPTEDEPMAAWLRALVGAMDYGVKNHQLLMEKPTERTEVRQDVSTDGVETQEALRDIRADLAELRKIRDKRSVPSEPVGGEGSLQDRPN